MSTALVWLRRDLRLSDNPALHQAAAAHEKILPVYIHAPEEEAPWEPGGASRWWLHESLAALAAKLREHGSQLLLRRGPTLATLRTLAQETGATAVYWNRLYEPAIIARDTQIKTALREDGLAVESSNGALLMEPWNLTKDDGGPYKVFTPFWKMLVRRLTLAAPLPVPSALPAPATWPESLPLEALELLPRVRWYDSLAAAWQPGETAAQERLAHFCRSLLPDYPDNRNRPGVDGVSRLSPHLHSGEISPRQVWTAVAEKTGGAALDDPAAEAFLRELGWREFSHYVLYFWPKTPDQPLLEQFNDYPWRSDYADLLSAWQQGRTGFPMVDAGMRELWHSGWMHNRVRMLAASFLTKNCRIPWQEGERWFWDTLVDADLANNTMGWQWTAGCGVDAAPYFRVFNPVRQGEQFDPEGVYLRRWLPELAELPVRWLQQPWALPEKEQRALNFTPGRDYPLPVVDLAASRKEALAGFDRIKQGS